MTTFRISNPEPPRIVIAADTEDRRTGTVEFRITNEASTYKRLAFSFVVLDAADHNAPDAPEGRWLATDGPGEGEVLAPGDSVQRIVTVSVPPGEPARDLAFRLLAYDGDRPDENADESVKIVVTLAEAVVQEVPDPPPRQRPSWLIPLLAVLGVAVPTIVVMAVLLGQEDVRHSTDLDGDGFCPEGLAEVFKPSSSKPRTRGTPAP